MQDLIKITDDFRIDLQKEFDKSIELIKTKYRTNDTRVSIDFKIDFSFEELKAADKWFKEND